MFPGMGNNELKIQTFARNPSTREFYLPMNVSKEDHVFLMYKPLPHLEL